MRAAGGGTSIYIKFNCASIFQILISEIQVQISIYIQIVKYQNMRRIKNMDPANKYRSSREIYYCGRKENNLFASIGRIIMHCGQNQIGLQSAGNA